MANVNARLLSILVLGLFGGAIVTASSCSSSGSSLAQVTGRVTYQGKPVARATVTFAPRLSGALPAIGVTNENGVYELGTKARTDGAFVGDYEVSIVARAPVTGSLPPGKGDAYLEELQANAKPLIPMRYFNSATSGLMASIKAGQNQLDFVLE